MDAPSLLFSPKFFGLRYEFATVMFLCVCVSHFQSIYLVPRFSNVSELLPARQLFLEMVIFVIFRWSVFHGSAQLECQQKDEQKPTWPLY